ncbi:hypothetical protein ABPG75_008654 [Micractinium tetrahymenae]
MENGEVSAVQASAFMVGCAWLGRDPGTGAIRACLEAVERVGDHRAAANMAWALAVLQACDQSTWSRLVAHVEGAAAELLDVQLVQLAQAYQMLRQQHGSDIPCPPDLLRRSLKAQASRLSHMQRHGRTCHFERALVAAVHQLAAGQDVQYACIATGRDGLPLALVDVALPQLRIAVEGNGPRRFLRGRGSEDAGQLQLNGPTQARNLVQQGADWLVVSLPSPAAWDPCSRAAHCLQMSSWWRGWRVT